MVNIMFFYASFFLLTMLKRYFLNDWEVTVENVFNSNRLQISLGQIFQKMFLSKDANIKNKHQNDMYML